MRALLKDCDGCFRRSNESNAVKLEKNGTVISRKIAIS